MDISKTSYEREPIDKKYYLQAALKHLAAAYKMLPVSGATDRLDSVRDLIKAVIGEL